MAIEIGRKHSMAIGIEATSGAAGPIDAWIPLEEGVLTPKTDPIIDESGFGTISAGSDAHVTKTWSEFTGKGIARPTSIGYLLLLALGTAGAPSLVETGVYSHAFTVKNDNTHPSATIIHDDATQEEQSTYNMIDALAITGEVSDYLRFDTKMTGRNPTDATGNTPAFVSETPFLVSRAQVKFATNVAGLAGASVVPVQSFNLNIEKNPEQIWSTESVAGTEALDFATQHNKDLRISGDFTIIYNSKTYRDLAIAGTLQAIEIKVDGRSLIGATKRDELTIRLNSAILTEWDRDMGNDSIVTQTFGFTALYKLSETSQITATLQNTKTSIYA